MRLSLKVSSMSLLNVYGEIEMISKFSDDSETNEPGDDDWGDEDWEDDDVDEDLEEDKVW